jgi:4a-hydroxytetrahydrobiopterin dehydratase
MRKSIREVVLIIKFVLPFYYMPDFLKKHCIPCEGGAAPLSHEEAQNMLEEVPGWELHKVAPSSVKGRASHFQIQRDFKFKNFKEAVAFVNKVAELAEHEGHHPNILLHSWNKVRLTLYTHAIGGLSENDFIVAAKINEIASLCSQ